MILRTITIEDDKGISITIAEDIVIIEHSDLDVKIIISAALLSYAARQLIEIQNSKH